jgi:probable HAF family extracellular repeat protein
LESKRAGYEKSESSRFYNGPIDPLTGSPHAAAALWKEGQIVDLGTLDGGTDSNAVGINDRGQIIGFASNLIPDPFDPFDPFGFSTQLRTFPWENGVIKDIGTLGGPDAVPGTGINNRGQITGSSYINSVPNPSTGVPTADPFLWEDGNMIDLGSFGGTNVFGLAVNNRGQVIGQSNLAGDVETHAFLWDEGILTDLRTLGGTVSTPTWFNLNTLIRRCQALRTHWGCIHPCKWLISLFSIIIDCENSTERYFRPLRRWMWPTLPIFPARKYRRAAIQPLCQRPCLQN